MEIEDRLTTRRKLAHEVTSLETNISPFLKQMKCTYASFIEAHPPKTGKLAVHSNWCAMFKRAVLDQASGPYQATKTHIEVQASALLRDADSELKKGCDEIFINIFRNFDQICPEQEDGGLKALERGKELKRNIDQAQRNLEEAKEALLSAGIKVV
jgi:hypothetical protein